MCVWLCNMLKKKQNCKPRITCSSNQNSTFYFCFSNDKAFVSRKAYLDMYVTSAEQFEQNESIIQYFLKIRNWIKYETARNHFTIKYL